jgi:O-succinylbenzoate synthase
MKIEQMTLHHLRMPLVAPFETSFGRIDHRECILIIVQSEGLTGYGECVADHNPGYSYETTGTALHILKDFIAPILINAEIKDADKFQQQVSGIRGHNFAKAGVEMALWDLAGKRAGKSLREIIGGEREKVEVGVSVGLQESAEALVKRVAGYLEKGYRRVKIKIKPGRDVGEASAVRKAFPDLHLQVDGNSAYTLESAQALKLLDDLNLLMIEQPLYDDDLWDHCKLQDEFLTPICLDESILSLRHARYAFEMEACRVINIKPGRVGGLSQGVAVHNLCQKNCIPVWCGGMLETGVGRAANLAIATLPNFSFPGDISASDRYYEHDITNERFELNPDSTIDVPRSPGLGVTLNQHALGQFSLAKIVLKSE